MRKSELHLFIIWSNAFFKKEEILKDIEEHFIIRNIFSVKWTDSNWERNISRFYGISLPDAAAKIKECGKERFLAVVVEDISCIYEDRLTSKGIRAVNSLMFDKKEQYRKMSGGGYKIHGTTNIKESDHDMTLLFGLNTDDFAAGQETSSDIIEFNKDLAGSDGWDDLRQLFYIMNNCCNYVVMRNYENLFKDIYVEGHNDVDILCDSKENVSLIVNGDKVHSENYRVQYKVNIDNYPVYFDIRHIGDDYYDRKLETEMLKSRIQDGGIYVLPKILYLYTLLYHALIQKKEIAEDYKKRINELSTGKIGTDLSIKDYCFLLSEWINENDYEIVKPWDDSVYFNYENAKLVYGNDFYDETLYFKQEYCGLIEENQRLKEKIEMISFELDIIRNSTSWKITRPLRCIIDKVRNWKDGIRK